MDKLTYKPVSHDHEEFLREAKKDDAFMKEYEALAPTYALARERFLDRQLSGSTESRMGGSRTTHISESIMR